MNDPPEDDALIVYAFVLSTIMMILLCASAFQLADGSCIRVSKLHEDKAKAKSPCYGSCFESEGQTKTHKSLAKKVPN